LKNPEAYRQKERIRQRKYRAAQRSLIRDMKCGKTCARCPEAHPACLQFHHLDPSQKAFSINRGVVMKMPLDVILAEMAKCILLCANCHAKEHWTED
jgi:hypothetical protein